MSPQIRGISFVIVVFLVSGGCRPPENPPPLPTYTPTTETVESTPPPPASATPEPTRQVVRESQTPSIPSRKTNTPSPAQPMIPLTDFKGETYYGFEGGLYPGGSNEMPPAHAREGLARAMQIKPLDQEGNPDPNGKYVLLIVGMSNTTEEVCGTRQTKKACNPWTFIGLSEQDPDVNHDSLLIIDGARGAQVAKKWDSPTDENYDRIANTILPYFGVTEQQVQVAWVKVTNPGPLISLPSEKADAYKLLVTLGDIVRALKTRYPNLKQVYFSSRIYAGYTTRALSPEPFAYENGFSVKWLIEAQIDQMAGGGTVIDPLAGDLNYNTVAPWLAWGPYLWANGLEPRSDGLIWELEDYAEDLTHPSQSGEAKVATMLLDFFKSSPFTRCWFLANGTCGEN